MPTTNAPPTNGRETWRLVFVSRKGVIAVVTCAVVLAIGMLATIGVIALAIAGRVTVDAALDRIFDRIVPACTAIVVPAAAVILGIALEGKAPANEATATVNVVPTEKGPSA